MDQRRLQTAHLDYHQALHPAELGEVNRNHVPYYGTYNQTANASTVRYSSSSNAPLLRTSALPYLSGARDASRQPSYIRSDYLPSSREQFREPASSGRSYHGARPTYSDANRYPIQSYTSSQNGVHTANTAGGATTVTQPGNGISQYPQYITQAPLTPPGFPNYPTLDQPEDQSKSPLGQYPKSGPPPHVVPPPESNFDIPRTSWPSNALTNPATAVLPGGNPITCKQRVQRSIDRLELTPHTYTASMPRSQHESPEHNPPSAILKVPYVEKSKSTSSGRKVNAYRPLQSLEQEQARREDRTPRQKTKMRKTRNLPPGGREHAKAVRQFPGGACKECKKKKIKACVSSGNVCYGKFLTVTSASTGWPRMLQS